MSYADNPYRSPSWDVVANLEVDQRVRFLRQTYLHLGAAVAAFVAIEAALLQMPSIGNLAIGLTQGYNWLLVLGAFAVVSWVADRWARSSTSLGMQYAGLFLYVVAEAVIFVPLLYFATTFDPQAIPIAGTATLVIFGGLTTVVFVTRQDFSFLRGVLGLVMIGAIGLVVCSILFGFELGTFFTVAMIVMAGGFILYDTSNVLHHYREGQHVAAALALFASVALLFFYVLRFVMSQRD